MRHYAESAFEIKLLRNDARDFGELQRQEIEEIARRDTLRNGYNTSPGGSVGTPDVISVAGKLFGSRAAAAAYFGIDSRVFNFRLGRLGWTHEQAAEIEPRKKFVRHRITVGCLSFPSLKAASKHFGIDYKLAHRRAIDTSWTVEQALGQAPPPDTVRYTGVEIGAFGMKFPSLAACARHFGVKPESLRSRVVNMGTEVEAAIRDLQTGPKAGARRRDAPGPYCAGRRSPRRL